jgi:hypothetical protein
MSVTSFLSYHNAVPIAVSIVVAGTGAAFAATNPESIYSQQQMVLSVDNTYIVGKDLSAYSPRTQVVAVTEDEENYYVEYTLHTIDLADAVWRDVVKQKQMKVAKALLGQYGDLGLHVTRQLKENIEQEAQRLRNTQEIERRNVSQKVVATQDGGLIGKMLDTTTETLPGYTPVVTPPPAPPAPSESVAAAAASGSGAQTPAPAPQPTGAPTVEVLGNNPARVPVGSAYSDLGAAITGPTPEDQALGIIVSVDGVHVQTPSIDTSAPREWVIRYEVTNASGQTGYAERRVIVYDPNVAEVSGSPDSASSTSPEVAPATGVPGSEDSGGLAPEGATPAATSGPAAE